MARTIVRHIWAKAGTATLPGGDGRVEVPVWGYTTDSCPCTIPGPVIEATEGDTLEITLHNTLSEPVSMIFPGQEYVPRPVKDARGRFLSFAGRARPQASATYAFRALRPGTFRYESGTNPEKQVRMGLAGVLLVRPAGFDPGDPATWSAYGPGTGSDYDQEQVLVLGEIDSRLHDCVAAGGPCDFSSHAPDWWTLNGRAFPDTLAPADRSSQPMSARISARVGQRILLRCVNVGLQPHCLHFGGWPVRVVAEDGRPLKTAGLDATYEKRTVTIGPGEVYDVILTPTSPGTFSVFDRDLHHLLNAGAFPGGMMTQLEVTP